MLKDQHYIYSTAELQEVLIIEYRIIFITISVQLSSVRAMQTVLSK